MRGVVRLISGCAVLLVASFIFLRLYGVPGPILREIIQRANDAGIAVDADRITLSLHGWRIENVRYYSGNPDDLNPLVHAREVLVARLLGVEGDLENRWSLNIEASDVYLSPSVDWGLHIPEENNCRRIDELELSIAIAPDRIVFSRGFMTWLGAEFRINGSVLKPEAVALDKNAVRPKAEKSFSLDISEQDFLDWEALIRRIQIGGKAVVDLDFLINTDRLTESRIDYRVSADDISYRNVEFSRFEVGGHYAHPSFVLEQGMLLIGSESVRMEGSYDFDSKEVQGSIKNSITSKELLLLLPQPALDLLVTAQLQFESLPQFAVGFGPALPVELLNSVDGRFSIQNVTYCQLLIESLRGRFHRSDNLLKLTDLRGQVGGQEEFAEEIGSCLKGGYISGEVFWDANSDEFGVSASGSMDPNLLLQPLAIVPVATNAIGRFKFEEQAPQISVELGSSYIDWSTFYINVQGTGNQVRFHDALLSSMNATGFYKHGVLRVEPLAVMAGVDFLKGKVSVDFKKSTVGFDAYGTLPPEVVEDGAYSKFNLFGNKLNTRGSTQIKAKGTLDWKTMEQTDFTAEVEAEHFEVPVAHMDDFSGTVIGKGPRITVTNAVCNLYGGAAEGTFGITLAPGVDHIMYSLDAQVKNASFRDFIHMVNPEVVEGNFGRMAGHIAFEADLKKDFFKSANGGGQVSVVDGQLADLPLFSGFSRLIRKVIPGFNAFTITSLRGDFLLTDGVISSENAYFGGDVISAKGRGRYSPEQGFDAYVHGQILNDNRISRVLRAITDPIFKLFEMRLSGSLQHPQWEMDKFSGHAGSKGAEE